MTRRSSNASRSLAVAQLHEDFHGRGLALMAKRRLAQLLARSQADGSTGISSFEARVAQGFFEARADLAPGAHSALLVRFALRPEAGSFLGMVQSGALLLAGPGRLVDAFARRAFERALAAERALVRFGSLPPLPIARPSHEE